MRSSEPTDSSVIAAFVEHDKSGIKIAFQSGSVLTSPASVAAAGPLTVSESQAEKPAHPPRKRLKLGLLKGGASNVMERQWVRPTMLKITGMNSLTWMNRLQLKFLIFLDLLHA
jgi:hypothetical protein